MRPGKNYHTVRKVEFNWWTSENPNVIAPIEAPLKSAGCRSKFVIFHTCTTFFWNFLVAFCRFGGLSPFPPYLIGASHNISLWNYSRSWIWVLNYNNHSCLDCKVPKVYCVSCSILNLVEFHGFICRQARSSILEYLSSSTAVCTRVLTLLLFIWVLRCRMDYNLHPRYFIIRYFRKYEITTVEPLAKETRVYTRETGSESYSWSTLW